MNIILTDPALRWFKEEMEAVPGESVRFFARYGGSSPLHEGFSLGVTKDEPDEIAAETEADGIRFYIEDRDAWYFDGHDLHVSLDENSKELSYSYEKPGNRAE